MYFIWLYGPSWYLKIDHIQTGCGCARDILDPQLTVLGPFSRKFEGFHDKQFINIYIWCIFLYMQMFTWDAEELSYQSVCRVKQICIHFVCFWVFSTSLCAYYVTSKTKQGSSFIRDTLSWNIEKQRACLRIYREKRGNVSIKKIRYICNIRMQQNNARIYGAVGS